MKHLKEEHPDALFYAVIYFPFPSSHANVQSRYSGQGIDGIFFAGETESSIEEAVVGFLSHAGVLKD